MTILVLFVKNDNNTPNTPIHIEHAPNSNFSATSIKPLP